MAEPPESADAGRAGSPAEGDGPGGVDAQSAGEPAAGAAPASPAPGPPAEEDDELEAAGQPRNPVVAYYFHGPVHAPGAQFGFTDERPTRRSTGRVEVAEVEQALCYYLGPQPYPAALATLRDRHLAVLPGDEDTGRRAGAFALLREVIGPAPLTSLSPTYTLAELRRYSFRAGQGYLVVDRLAEPTTTSQEQRFEAEQLLNRLAETGAYLVVTTQPTATRGWPPEVVLGWDRPDPQELVDHCLARAAVRLTEPQVAKARERVAQRPGPRDVVSFVDQIAVHGIDAAIRTGDDEDRQRVRQWFETAARPRHEVVEVAAVAFAYGLPRRTFERLCAGLQALADAYSRKGQANAAAPDDGVLSQSWAARNGGESLVAAIRSEPGSPRVAFQSARYRQEVLVQLVERYGDELWTPVEEWLREQARTTDDEVRGTVALGLAIHARNEPAEVTALLDRWANGTVMERLTASYVLSWMCLHDDLAPAALRTATGWAVGAGPRRAWTAAVALGGELGVRYQTEALRWLSHVSLRAERLARPARESIADLFRDAEHVPGNAATLLRFLHRWLRQRLDEGDVAEIRPALRTVVTVLGAERRESTQPVAAYVLRKQPDTGAVLGALWTAAMRSAPHRGDAIEALRATVSAVGPNHAAEQVVQDLARAIRSRWSGEERRLRLEQLEPAMRPPSRGADDGKRLWKTFVETLMGDNNDQTEDGNGDDG